VVKLDRELTNMTNAKGQTPCHIAAETENAAALNLLLNTGVADLSLVDGEGDTVLLTAAKNGAEDVVNACIDAGVGLDASRDGDGKTSVYEACYYGHSEVVRLLVDAGADLAKTDNKGWHPLHAAAWGHGAGDEQRLQEYAAIVQTLLNKGAPVDVENDEVHACSCASLCLCVGGRPV
jgi:ankyrin repeat protein